MNKLTQEKIELIQQLAREGKSVRFIADVVKAHKFTVNRYMSMVEYPNSIDMKPKKQKGRKYKQHFLNCGYCNKQFLDVAGEKTSDLKCGRIKRAFCCHRCAMNYRSQQRHNDKCKRCKLTRIELAKWTFEDSPYQATGISFTKGYCPKCWGLLYQYKHNEELVVTHELTQQLKKEIQKCQQ